MAEMCRHIYLPIVRLVDSRHRFSCPPLLSIVFFSFPRWLLLHLFPPLTFCLFFVWMCLTYALLYFDSERKTERWGRKQKMCVFFAFVFKLYSLLPVHPTTLSFPLTFIFTTHLIPAFFLFFFFLPHSTRLFLPLNSTLHICWLAQFLLFGSAKLAIW